LENKPKRKLLKQSQRFMSSVLQVTMLLSKRFGKTWSNHQALHCKSDAP
jgi:hypothetical protein